mmetsp:Transcript_75452/g.179227  ORF Transcript_75452/g.179227 Transcript_75452/m.179227 type:complete len:267 (+) Transcript_75452:76-876(+)
MRPCPRTCRGVPTELHGTKICARKRHYTPRQAASLAIAWICLLGLGLPSCMTMLEIERKYQTPPDLQERVLRQGGTKIETKAFTDVYYDKGCLLGRNNCWLRRRDSTFELKVPCQQVTEAPGSNSQSSSFREITDPTAIAAELQKIAPDFLPPAETADSDAFHEALMAQDFRPYAKFATNRSTFEIEGVSIASDVADFGHSVTEVEVLLQDTSDSISLAEADIKVENVAHSLGLEPLPGDQGGKLHEYLREYNPEYQQELREAGVI